MLESILFFRLVRVAPKEVKHLLVVLGVISSELDLEWSLNLLNSLDVLNRWTDTTVAAENSLLFISNNSCKRHLLECLINLCKDTVWIIDIFSESLGALVSESKILIDVLILMVSSQEHNLLWILQLKSEEKADHLKTVLTLVNIITQEEIIEGMDISGVKRSLPDVEESHEVNILTVYISNDLHWWSDLLDDDWLSGQDLGTLVGKLDDVLPLAWELSTWLDVLSLPIRSIPPAS
jgi:hypothetical protein